MDDALTINELSWSDQNGTPEWHAQMARTNGTLNLFVSHAS